MSSIKCFVKQPPDERKVYTISQKVDIATLKPGVRVGIKNSEITMVLPSTVDPVVNLMRIEKVPDCTYDQVGGLSK